MGEDVSDLERRIDRLEREAVSITVLNLTVKPLMDRLQELVVETREHNRRHDQEERDQENSRRALHHLVLAAVIAGTFSVVVTVIGVLLH